ncbi:hypothetical protein FE257_000864 [Aspergillus nanangensis]|uniref:Major facilitator superfamily (MFS) profile domain-containing protein n=1 Tax=Aspergillus nanangensis TaxID=2582783 RepID=A0AAD4CEI7_ASPNN|nr:hypothetical protein FE257_000864 [Aspergillus nanangensis]
MNHETTTKEKASPNAIASNDPSESSATATGDAHESNDAISYPEGGWAAWSVVLGSWMICFGTMGILNSVGIFQAYMQENQLHDYSAGQVAWIFGLYTFLAFFCGIQVGPIFDAKGPRVLVICGSIGTVLFLLLLGLCREYWHFMLVFGPLAGTSVSLGFNPAISIVAHYFNKNRGFATGVASSGASFGGVIFPLLFQGVASKVGFVWATRAISLLTMVAFIFGIILVRPRTPSKNRAAIRAVLFDLSAFRDTRLMLASMGIFFMEWGLFGPITYLTSYALAHGTSSGFAYLLLSLVNLASIFGRLIPGYCADRIGRFNTLIITIFACLLVVSCLWVTAGASHEMMLAFALLFGFASGSNVSLAPVCVGQLCRLEAYGRYYATAYAVVSISCLTAIPIAGAILTQCDGEYWGLIAFTAVSYGASLLCLVGTKIFCCKENSILAIF